MWILREREIKLFGGPRPHFHAAAALRLGAFSAPPPAGSFPLSYVPRRHGARPAAPGGGECQCLALHGAQGLPEASAFHACTASCAGSRKDGSRGSGAPTVGVGDSEVRESRCCVMLPASKGASGTGRSALQGVLPRHECITSCPVVPAAVRGECPPIFPSQRRSLTQKVY